MRSGSVLLAAAGLAALPLLASEPVPGVVVTKDDNALKEVMVTARRREENLQSVPAAISVVDGEWLDDSRTVNTQQLSQLVPSLYYNSANPRNTAYTIRGLGSNTLSVSAANDGIEPGVGLLCGWRVPRASGNGRVRLHGHRAGGSAAWAAGNAVRQEHHRGRHPDHQPRPHLRT